MAVAKIASMGGRHPRQGATMDDATEGVFEQWPEDVDFGPLADLIGYALRRAQISIYRDFFASVGELGFTPQLFAALVLIERNPSLNQTRLGSIMGINRAAAKALVDRLENMTLVKRETSKSDKRATTVVMTKLGQEGLSTLVQTVRAHDIRASQNLTPKELSTLRRLLRKF